MVKKQSALNIQEDCRSATRTPVRENDTALSAEGLSLRFSRIQKTKAEACYKCTDSEWHHSREWSINITVASGCRSVTDDSYHTRDRMQLLNTWFISGPTDAPQTLHLKYPVNASMQSQYHRSGSSNSMLSTSSSGIMAPALSDTLHRFYALPTSAAVQPFSVSLNYMQDTCTIYFKYV